MDETGERQAYQNFARDTCLVDRNNRTLHLFVKFLFICTITPSFVACGGGQESSSQARQREQAEHQPDGRATSAFAVVAHQDDDLLFMGSSLQNHLRQNHNVTIVFLTAGDAGKQSPAYWQSRELGIKAAYSQLTGLANTWAPSAYAVGNNNWHRETLLGYGSTFALVFLRFPDGQLGGRGSKSRNNESLGNLWHGRNKILHAVDGSNAIDRDTLISTLSQMERDAIGVTNDVPEVHILNCLPDNLRTHDHPDHRFSALFALKAHDEIDEETILHLHRGYSSALLSPNLSENIATRKWAAFSTYATYDTDMHLDDPNWLKMTYYARLRVREYAWRQGSKVTHIDQDTCDLNVRHDDTVDF